MTVLMWNDELVGVYTDVMSLLTAMVKDAESRGSVSGYSIERISL